MLTYASHGWGFWVLFYSFPPKKSGSFWSSASDAEPGKETGCHSAERTATLETLHGLKTSWGEHCRSEVLGIELAILADLQKGLGGPEGRPGHPWNCSARARTGCRALSKCTRPCHPAEQSMQRLDLKSNQQAQLFLGHVPGIFPDCAPRRASPGIELDLSS